jgi:hypothetical protein
MVARHWKKGDTKDFRYLKKAIPLLFTGSADHVSEMDDKVRLSINDALQQPRVGLWSVSTVSDHHKMVRGVEGFDSFDTLPDLSDRLGLSIEREDEKESTERQRARRSLSVHHSPEMSYKFHLQILP